MRKRKRRHLNQIRTADPQQIFLFPALSVRNNYHSPQTERLGNDRQPDASITTGRFNEKASTLNITARKALAKSSICPGGPLLTARDS